MTVRAICPTCGSVDVVPDFYDHGVPVSGVCPLCEDRVYFALPDTGDEEEVK